MLKHSTILLGILSASLLCSTAQAAWTLNGEQSSLHFATVKNATVSEVHQFKELSGAIADDGKASLMIKLASVDTNNPIRDERMQKQLFDTEKFPDATISIDLGTEALKNGAQTIVGTLNLHGVEKEVSTQVFVEQNDTQITVSSLAPIVVAATDFGLDGGVEVLRELAALTSINVTVPASFRLVYDKQ